MPPTRGPRAADREEAWRGRPAFARVAADALAAALEQPGPQTLCASGVVFAFRGEIDRAIAAFEEAREAAPDDAGLAVDCATVYIERAFRGGNGRDFARALAHSDAALRLDPSLPEAMFNRALALEHLSLRAESQQQWQTYLAIEPDPDWSAEASRHLMPLLVPTAIEAWNTVRPTLELAALEGRDEQVNALVRTSPGLALAFARDELPGRWARAVLAGDVHEANCALRILHSVAACVLATTGDAYPCDASAEIEAAAGPRRSTLAVAHAALAEGLELYERRSIVAARERLIIALENFAAARAPTGALVCRIERARCDVWAIRYDDALAAIESVRREAERRGYPHLTGRCLWIEGFIRGARFEVPVATKNLVEARRIFSDVSDTEGLSNASELLASLSAMVGDADAAWEGHLASLAAAAAYGDLGSYARGAGTFSQQVAREGEFEAAVYFADAALRMPGVVDATTCAVTLCNRAGALAHLGRFTEAESDLASARELLGGVSDVAMRVRGEAEVALAGAEVLSGSDPTAATARLSEILDTYAASGDRTRTANVFGLRAAAHEASGDLARAAEDYAACVREMEAERRASPEERMRVTFSARPEPVFDRAAAFEFFRASDPDAALWFSESHRARSLLDALDSQAGTPDDLDRWLDGSGRLAPALAALPANVAVVEYGLFADAAVAWVCTRDGVVAEALPVSGPVLERQALAYRSAVEKGTPSEELARLSAPLFRALFDPLRPALRGRSPVVIVPDKALQQLPFAALIDPDTGKFVAEQFELAVSPSLAIYARCAARDVALAATGRGGRALAVGNPWFSRERYPGLTDLRAAETEANRVAALYPGSELLTGRAARRAVFLRLAPRYEVVHFAGHALFEVQRRLEPELVFAEEATGDVPGGIPPLETVGTDDIRSLTLRRTRLVVLAACGTADRAIPGEGLAGLVRAFLAAGAPVVAASLWAADDRAATPLFVEFHRRLRSGEGHAAALAAAQRAMITSPDVELRAPRHWAAFELFGGPRD